MTSHLQGLPAVVTGSSRGLGRAFSRALASAGARVVVNGTDPHVTERTVSEIRDAGGTAIGVVGSVADHDFCVELVKTCVAEFGSIGLLVNNAGITRDRSVLKMTPDEFDQVIAVHLRGTWSASAEAARVMRGTGGGRIVNISSGSGLYGMFGQANYAAAKAGIVGLSRVLDLELSRYGIITNVLNPVARTDMTAVLGTAEEFPDPDTVAPVLVYLASEASAHIRGQVLSFDGTTLSVWSHPQAAATWTEAAGWTPETISAVLTPDVLESPHPDRWGAPA